MDIRLITAKTYRDNREYLVTLDFLLKYGITGGPGLQGDNYTFVKGDKGPQENFNELLNAINQYASITQDGVRDGYVIVAPGVYSSETPLVINMNRVSVVSLTGGCDVKIPGGVKVESQVGHGSPGTITIRGIDTVGEAFVTEIADGKDYTFENCKGGDDSFQADGVSLLSTFIDCEGKNRCFGYGATIKGKFYNCKAGEDSMGSASGATIGAEARIINCEYYESEIDQPMSGGIVMNTICWDSVKSEYYIAQYPEVYVLGS